MPQTTPLSLTITKAEPDPSAPSLALSIPSAPHSPIAVHRLAAGVESNLAASASSQVAAADSRGSIAVPATAGLTPPLSPSLSGANSPAARRLLDLSARLDPASARGSASYQKRFGRSSFGSPPGSPLINLAGDSSGSPLRSPSSPGPLIWKDAPFTPPPPVDLPLSRSMPTSPSITSRSSPLLPGRLPLGPHISLSASMSPESTSQRQKRQDADLRYLLCSSTGTLFLNAYVKKAAAEVTLHRSMDVVQRKSSVADEANRRVALKKALQLAADTMAMQLAAASASDSSGGGDAAVAVEQLVEAALSDRSTARAPAPDEVELLQQFLAEEPELLVLRASGGAQLQLNPSDEDTTAPNSSGGEVEEEERARKHKKRAAFRAKREARNRRLEKLLERRRASSQDEEEHDDSVLSGVQAALDLAAADNDEATHTARTASSSEFSTRRALDSIEDDESMYGGGSTARSQGSGMHVRLPSASFSTLSGGDGNGSTRRSGGTHLSSRRSEAAEAEEEEADNDNEGGGAALVPAAIVPVLRMPKPVSAATTSAIVAPVVGTQMQSPPQSLPSSSSSSSVHPLVKAATPSSPQQSTILPSAAQGVPAARAGHRRRETGGIFASGGPKRASLKSSPSPSASKAGRKGFPGGSKLAQMDEAEEEEAEAVPSTRVALRGILRDRGSASGSRSSKSTRTSGAAASASAASASSSSRNSLGGGGGGGVRFGSADGARLDAEGLPEVQVHFAKSPSPGVEDASPVTPAVAASVEAPIPADAAAAFDKIAPEEADDDDPTDRLGAEWGDDDQEVDEDEVEGSGWGDANTLAEETGTDTEKEEEEKKEQEEVEEPVQATTQEEQETVAVPAADPVVATESAPIPDESVTGADPTPTVTASSSDFLPLPHPVPECDPAAADEPPLPLPSSTSTWPRLSELGHAGHSAEEVGVVEIEDEGGALDSPANAASSADKLFEGELPPSVHQDHSFAASPFASAAAAAAAAAGAGASTTSGVPVGGWDASSPDPSSLYFSDARRTSARLPAPGSMSYFRRTPTNNKKNAADRARATPEILKAFPGVKARVEAQQARDAAKAERARLAAIQAALPSEPLGFGSGAKARPRSSTTATATTATAADQEGLSPSRRLMGGSKSAGSLRDPHLDDPVTLRSITSPSGRSARRIFGVGGGAATRTQVGNAADTATLESASTWSPSARERMPDGSLRPPWAQANSRSPGALSPAAAAAAADYHVDPSSASLRPVRSPGGMPVSLRPKQRALASKIVRMNGFVPPQFDEFDEPISLSNGELALQTQHLTPAAHVAATRRHVRKLAKLDKGGGGGLYRSGSDATLTHSAPTVSAVSMRSTVPRPIEVAHALDALFHAPPVSPPSPFIERNLFEHVPTTANSSRRSTQRSSIGGQGTRRSEPGDETRRTAAVYNFAAEQQSVSTARGLASSAPSPVLLRPVSAGRGVLSRGLTSAGGVGRVPPQPRDALLLQAAQRRKQTHARVMQQTAAASRNSSPYRRTRNPTSGTDGSDAPAQPTTTTSWSEVMMLEAELVAAQKQQLQHAMELERMLDVSAAVQQQQQQQQASEESKEEQASGGLRSQRISRGGARDVHTPESGSPLRASLSTPPGHAYALPVPLDPVSPQRSGVPSPQQLQEYALHSLPRASRLGPARTFGGADPLLLSSSASSPTLLLNIPPSAAVVASASTAHDWAGTLLQRMFDGSHHQHASVHTSGGHSADPLDAWRAAQQEYGHRSSPAALAHSAEQARQSATLQSVSLSTLLAGLPGSARAGAGAGAGAGTGAGARPARSEYARKLLEQRQAEDAARARARKIAQLASPGSSKAELIK